MKVIDHEPQSWFLLDDGGVLYLDAHCSHSAFDYSVLIALNSVETSAFAAKGRAYLKELAHDIHYSAPAILGNTSPFRSRNLTGSRGEESERANAAIEDWLASQPGAR